MKQNRKVIGITGGVGAGKSIIMEILRDRYRADIILSDLTAHRLMEPGEDNWKGIVECFGREILRDDGTIDRGKLSGLVFSDPEKLAALNAITHPGVIRRIREEIRRFRREGNAPLLAVESALLPGSGLEEDLDAIWYIYVDDAVRAKRLEEGRGYTPEKTRSVLEKQKSDAEFRSCASLVIDNSGSVEETEKLISDALDKEGIILY
ncbi:MAG: dephospho-CoA kinase [Eubacterium sp.]|nr:dephospho-CoA kinase [Eubacterium sp.]